MTNFTANKPPLQASTAFIATHDATPARVCRKANTGRERLLPADAGMGPRRFRPCVSAGHDDAQRHVQLWMPELIKVHSTLINSGIHTHLYR